MDEDYGGVEMNGSIRGSIIAFQDVKYVLRQKKLTIRGKRINIKKILNDVSGILKPGMNAIMGPTGGGKTSLLDVLAGIKNPRYKSGTVLIDGKLQPANFRCFVGYVQQKDCLCATMTVRENIRFAAHLKLPSGTSKQIREARVDKIISQLHLDNCADTYIGDEFLRGVSGGESKRTAVGMALIHSPSVLFLDEPTTGLDAHTAFSVMNLLSQLAKSGHTIIFSIHQPRYTIFKLIDYLLLLNRGSMVFQGPREELLPYFANMGYEIETNNNPADFVIDVITTVTGDNASQLSDTTFSNKYLDSELYSKINTELVEIVQQYELNEGIVSRTEVSFVSRFTTQLYALSNRSFLGTIRDPKTCLMESVSSLIIGLLVGVVYFQLDDDFKAGIFNRMGVFFFLSNQLMFKHMSAIAVFFNDRLLFINENSGGYYRTSAFFLTKLGFDILLMRLAPTIILSFVTYWMIGLDPNPIKYLLYLLNMFLTTLASVSLVMFCTSTFQTVAIINISCSFTIVIMMIFSGMLINISTIAVWLRWIQFLSIIRQTLSIFLIIEMKDKKYCSTLNNTERCAFGNNFLEESDIYYETEWDLWFLYLCNFAMYIGLNILTYIQLRRVNKYK